MRIPSRPQEFRRGIAAVEMAVILPVIVLLLCSVWEYGRLIEGKQILTNAVREGGRAASTGARSTTEVQQTITNYLANNGIGTTGISFQIQNLTYGSRSNPKDGLQLDHYRITATLPADNVRWVVLNKFVSLPSLTVTMDWYSMNNVPVDVPTDLPVE